MILHNKRNDCDLLQHNSVVNFLLNCQFHFQALRMRLCISGRSTIRRTVCASMRGTSPHEASINELHFAKSSDAFQAYAQQFARFQLCADPVVRWIQPSASLSHTRSLCARAHSKSLLRDTQQFGGIFAVFFCSLTYRSPGTAPLHFPFQYAP
jgi:hypothetical protein